MFPDADEQDRKKVEMALGTLSQSMLPKNAAVMWVDGDACLVATKDGSYKRALVKQTVGTYLQV